eukprot:gnl/MRDRNA2_/MRDRNA2_74660_c0_seq2.p1 gnl/MRDRNA2_/MRDRNA2_74660_c0~~gnl/MRDRNA2_/MRDRNA2_74660_c0_seq2.p1  ORF type:complete len:1156 (+),score=233.59 gnl/MRDRNA2_/MRDRNA2_74660_c0_seq2:25-3468(+)
MQRDNGNGRTVRNIIESSLRTMSARVVSTTAKHWMQWMNEASQKTYLFRDLVTTLEAIDLAGVGGDLLTESLRSTCQEEDIIVTGLEDLARGPHIMALPGTYKNALHLAQENCTEAHKMLKSIVPDPEVEDFDVSFIPILDKHKSFFVELDEKIGLQSVKRAMRQLYSIVQYAEMRKELKLKPLKQQAFHMRFVGNPGTGKTVMARLVGKLLSALGVIEKPSSNETLKKKVSAFKVDDKVELFIGKPDCTGDRMEKDPKCQTENLREGWMKVRVAKEPYWDENNNVEMIVLTDKSKSEKAVQLSRVRPVEKELYSCVKSNDPFVEVSRADLVGGHLGETAMKTKQVVECSLGGILFVDEAYSLVQEDGDDDYGHEAVNTLIKEMEDHRDKVIVVLAGYRDEMEEFFQTNPGFASRVPFTLDFPDYTCEELKGIAELQLEKNDVQLADAKAAKWFEVLATVSTQCCTNAFKARGKCPPPPRDNGNGRTVRNIIEAGLRRMSDRVVQRITEDRVRYRGENLKQVVQKMEDVDIAGVAGDRLAEVLRSQCQSEGRDPSGIEQLASAARMIALKDYRQTFETATKDCRAARSILEKTTPNRQLEMAMKAQDGCTVKNAEPKIQSIFGELCEKIGLQSAKVQMKRLYSTLQMGQYRIEAGLKKFNEQSYHMQFLGSPGVGKTVVARLVGDLLIALGIIKQPEEGRKGKGFIEASRSDVVGMTETGPKVKNVVNASLGGVLFIDEAYSLVNHKGIMGGDRLGQECVDTLIKEMEDKRSSFITIFAGYPNEMADFFNTNPGLKSRVPFTIQFDDYTCSQLGQIGHLLLEKRQLQVEKSTTTMDTYHNVIKFVSRCCDDLDDCQEAFDKKVYKGNGRDVRNIIERAEQFQAWRLYDHQDDDSSISADQVRARFETLMAQDFCKVMDVQIDKRLAKSCSDKSEVREVSAYFESVLTTIKVIGPYASEIEDFKEIANDVTKVKPIEGERRPGIINRLERLVIELNSVNISMQCVSVESEEALSKCQHNLEGLSYFLGWSANLTCADKGIMDGLVADITKATNEEKYEDAGELYIKLKTMMKDVETFWFHLIEKLKDSHFLDERFEPGHHVTTCFHKIIQIRTFAPLFHERVRAIAEIHEMETSGALKIRQNQDEMAK